MAPNTRNIRKIRVTAFWGVWLSSAAAVLLAAYFCFIIMTALTDTSTVSQELIRALELDGSPPPLSKGQATGLALVWFVTDAIGLLVLLTARSLFRAIRNAGIYAERTARLVRRVGWLVFSLAPVSVVFNALCRAWLVAIRDPGTISINISIDEADVYALVLGLLIVALGHIMVDATANAAENEAFV